METIEEVIEVLTMFREAEMEQSRIVQDENLGFVFYLCSNALFEALEKSMA